MDTDEQVVADRIAAALDRSGVSLRKFAKAVGTSASRLIAYRDGDTVPSAAMFLKIERVADEFARIAEQRDQIAMVLQLGEKLSTRPRRPLVNLGPIWEQAKSNAS